MSYYQWVVPNTGATDATGMCLRFAQRVFQNLNPYYYNSATEAWNNTKYKNYSRNIPLDVAVPVWFSHYGTYGSPATYDNWGHVVVWIPGAGYLSSPAWGFGQQWFPTIESVERAFNARYVGWSLDIGGLNVAWPKTTTPAVKPAPKPKIDEDTVPKRNEVPQYNPNQNCPVGKWSTLVLNKKGDVTILFPGAKPKRGTASVAVVADGEFDIRFVYDTISADGKKVTNSAGSVISRYEDRASHHWPIYLAAKGKGGGTRLRIQVRPAGGKPVKVTAVRPIVDYWEV